MRPWGHAARLAFALLVLPKIVHAQGSGAIPSPTTVGPSGLAPPAAFSEGQLRSRPEHVEEGLIGIPRDIPVVPCAPTLPDLTHTEPEMSIEQTIASVAPRAGSFPPGSYPDQPRLTSYLFNLDAEVPLASFLYVGGAWGFAAARGANAPNAQFVPGQPELFARVVRAFRGERYDIGAGLGVLPPVFTYDDRNAIERLEAATAVSLASVVRPWDVSMFYDRRVTARPWIDLRTKGAHLVAQFRQAVDVGYRVSAPPCPAGIVCDRAGDLQVLSISTLYLGWQPRREIALGLEAWEVYLLKTQFQVSDRTAFALSPSVRFFYRWVEPALSAIFPIGPTLLGAADGYYGLRLDMRVWFGGR